jgi:hypothetical protein
VRLPKFNSIPDFFLLTPPMKTGQIVSKRHIKFRNRGINQKKKYNNNRIDIILKDPLVKELEKNSFISNDLKSIEGPSNKVLSLKLIYKYIRTGVDRQTRVW